MNAPADPHDEHLENAPATPAATLDEVVDALVQHAVSGNVMRSEGSARRFFVDARPHLERYATAISRERAHELQVAVHKAGLENKELRAKLACLDAERAKLLGLAICAVAEAARLRDGALALGKTDLSMLEEQLRWLSGG